jgi:hypothetical protein
MVVTVILFPRFNFDSLLVWFNIACDYRDLEIALDNLLNLYLIGFFLCCF